jgi:rod shape-determining protein MreC
VPGGRGKGVFPAEAGREVRFLAGNKKVVLVVAVVTLAAIVATGGWRSGEDAGMLDRTVTAFTAPLLKGVENLAGVLGGAADFLLGWRGLREENRHLRAEVLRLQREAAERREREMAYRRLADMLEYREETGYDMAVAAVIGHDATNLFRTVLINKGKRDGLGRNLAVVTPGGVVGRIIRVYSTTARVLLLTDRSSGIDAIVQRTRDQGVVQGLGLQQLEMKYLSRQSTVAVGDTVVTSGMEGVFPKGVRIGTVKNVKKGGYLLQKVEISPPEGLDRLEEVFVLMPEGAEP